jgi:hypothetical protein
MRNGLAERILGWFTTVDRAASIVGDLTERAEARGVAWFWWSVLATAGRLAVVPAAMFTACMAVQLAAFFAASSVLNALSRERHGRALPMTGVALGISAVLLSSITLYLAWRYGLRRARLAGALTIAAFAGSCLQRTPHVVEAAIVLVLALTAAAAASRSWRRLTGSMLAALTVSAAVLIAEVMLANLTTHRPVLPFPVNYIAVVAAQWIAFRYWPPEPELGAAVGTSLE